MALPVRHPLANCNLMRWQPQWQKFPSFTPSWLLMVPPTTPLIHLNWSWPIFRENKIQKCTPIEVAKIECTKMMPGGGVHVRIQIQARSAPLLSSINLDGDLLAVGGLVLWRDEPEVTHQGRIDVAVQDVGANSWIKHAIVFDLGLKSSHNWIKPYWIC